MEPVEGADVANGSSIPQVPIPVDQVSNKKAKTCAAWAHYTMMKKEDGLTDRNDIAICKYYGTSIMCASRKNGTTALSRHLQTCKKSPLYEVKDKRQSTIRFEKEADGTTKLVAWKFNQERAKLMCVRHIIRDELPFSHVEKQGFKDLMEEICPEFKILKRKAIAKAVWSLFLEEKLKLGRILKERRVSITTDTWTSIQNINYLVLTAHFMDDGWVLQKRIINFSVIGNHSGDNIGKLVETCLLNWGIDKIFTITVDNASSNDVAVEFLKKRLASWKTLQLGGDFLHLRCCCHIINLIVQDGMKELNASIMGIRNGVRYIRHSPQRLQRFRDMAVVLKLDSQANVGLDVSTRWNSTYLMLVAAKKYQKVFESLGEEDVSYINSFKDPKSGFQKQIGPPDNDDWENASAFIQYLKIFYEATLHLSATKSITSNQVHNDFTGIHMQLVSRINNEEEAVLCKVAKVMKLKFDKYWGKFEKVNQLMLVANVLDPRWKLDYIPYCYADVGTQEEDIEVISSQVKRVLMKLYKEYKEFYPEVGNSYIEDDSNHMMDLNASASEEVVDVRVERLNRFVALRKAKKVVEICNEVDKYLMEAPENPRNEGFELSSWWKENTPRYPILSRIAKDIFAIPVSTVASESAFSLGSRIVDPFRSSLTSKMVEALVCCCDWLKANEFCVFKEPTVEALELYKECEEIEADPDKVQIN